MLTWEECSKLLRLSLEEVAAMGGREPASEFIDFVIEPYLYSEPLKDKPGIREFIIDDIESARRRGSYDLSALLKVGVRRRLMEQGYAGEMPQRQLARAI